MGRAMNQLFFGDNLTVLRDHVKDESIDLVYLDPPFNSNANYNVLFKASSGQMSEAQAEAFIDTWRWGEAAELSFEDVLHSPHQNAAIMLRAMRSAIGTNDMMAYLAMMASRLIELHRALMPTGSLYLHCDSTASHYLKILLDAVFGKTNYGNEIIWKRTSAKGLAFTRFARNHDVILRYTKTETWTWNPQYTAHDPEYVEKFYRYTEPDTGRKYTLDNLLNPNKNRPNLTYEFLGVTRVWRWTRDRMEDAYAKGVVVQTSPGSVPRLKRYLDEQEGTPVGDVWTDIRPVQSQSEETLGYPTQKPVSLLERIISASSNEGDIVLDPFCGCGTTIEAASKLKRKWIGIDVTHYAVTLIQQRLARVGVAEKEYIVRGRPTDIAGARDLARRDKHQFQWWAAWRLGAQTYREEKKGADRGVDGNIFFANGPYGTGRIIISVKGGENVGVAMVRDLRGVIEREEAEMGILVTLAEPTSPMISEAAAAGFVRKSAHGKIPRIQIVTIADILDGRTPKLPSIPVPSRSRAPSRAKRKSDQLEMLLPFEGLDIKQAKGEFIDPRFMKFG